MAEMIAGRYIIVKQVGEGGMATVYLCIDTILKREVAIKVLRRELTSDEVSLARFQREAMAITSTSHPNIVEVYDVGSENGLNYIVMEYVHGRTLKGLIRSRGVMPVDEAVNIMKQLVSATSHAHRQGIIHRDIKSQNVLVKDDGTVKLSDFGIAQMGDSAQQLTQAETVVGSVHYLAPELATGKPASFQSDIYALGIVFYEMLTGDVPFHGDTAVEIALKHMHNDVPNVRDFNPTIPQSVENIIIRATCRDPNLRYESAEKMYADLVTCLDMTRNEEEKVDLIQEKQQSEKDAARIRSEKKNQKTNRAAVHDANGTGATIAIIVLLAILALLIYGLIHGFGADDRTVVIPEVYQYQLEDVKDRLSRLDLTIEAINYEASDELEKGLVIDISPRPGTEVNRGGYVTLTVSLGKSFTFGNYVGYSIDGIRTQLENEDFTVTVNYVNDPDHSPYGTIIYQNVTSGTVFQANESRRVTFEVADYASFTIARSIIGLPVDEAKQKLESQGAVVELVVLSIENNIDTDGNYIYPSDTVVNTDPAAGSLYRQTEDAVLKLYYYSYNANN